MKCLNKQAIANQKGVSIVAVIAAMLILSVMGVTLISLVTTGSDVSINQLRSEQAFNVAEGGLENATLLLNTSDITNRISCANVNANLNAKPLGAGQFTVTADVGSPFYPALPTTLNGAIGIADATINVNSTVGYALSGRIMIDRELIDYSAISGNSFIGAARGSDGTIAVAHANGASVGQYQCTVTSIGGIPSVAAPSAQRQVTEGIQLQEGWAVGAGPTMLRWNGTAWSAVGLPAGANQTLNSVSILSYADAWVVGNNGGGGAGLCTNGRILRWNGSSWVCVASPINQILRSVFMISSQDGWAVGNAGAAGQRPVILQWNGNAWNLNNSGLVINVTLNSVYCTATNDCWTVGNNDGNEVILHWNGAAWSRVGPSGTISNRNLMSVYCVNNNDCWAVGRPGTIASGERPWIIRWNGVSWSTVLTGLGINVTLNSVYCTATNDCWTVGNNDGNEVILHWNGAAWSRFGPYAGIPNVNLNSVYCVDSTDCWAVGNPGGAGQRPVTLHWDGTAWALNNSGLNINQSLRGVHIIGPKQRPQAAWQEVFP